MLCGTRRVLIGCAMILVAGAVSADDRVTDEILSGMFGRAHTAMKDLRQHLHGALDAFLSGDAQEIQTHTGAITSAMDRVSRNYAPAPGKEAEQWQAVTEIVTSARAMETAAKRGDYQTSYQHYAQLTNRCIACHQVRRAWGTFGEAQAPASAAP